MEIKNASELDGIRKKVADHLESGGTVEAKYSNVEIIETRGEDGWNDVKLTGRSTITIEFYPAGYTE